jgi:transketolase
MYDLNLFGSSREAYGDELIKLGEKNQNIVVLDADLTSSTKTDKFAKKYPKRFINVGIAEQNLMGIASGLARSGKIPFVSTFAIFGCGRAWEQIRNNIAIDGLNVNIVLTHGGISLEGDGSTHQMLEDIALMQTLPGMGVIVPSDPVETRAVIRFASNHNGPIYIRLPRCDHLLLFDENRYKYDPREYLTLEDGSDVTIFSYGIMVGESLKAAYELKNEGISARVVNASTIKPLPKKTILKSARETGAVVSVEDHHIIGGLGSSIAGLLVENYPVKMRILGIQDIFGESGTLNEIHAKHGLTSKNITRSVKDLLNKKGGSST